MCFNICMNPFKINQNLTFNIYAFNIYVVILLHIINYFLSSFMFRSYYIWNFTIYYLIFFVLLFFPNMFFLEIIIRKKFVWKFSEEYKNNKFALTFFWTGICLNIIYYFVIYKFIFVWGIKESLI